MDFRTLSCFINVYVLLFGSCSNGCHNRGFDCQDLLDMGHSTSGVYHVTPQQSRFGFVVYCDMDTDSGGWLVFQRRQDGSEDFYRNWTDYERGFGDPQQEYWLGLVPLKEILSQGNYELRIDLEDWNGEKRFAKYRNFDVGHSLEKYQLTVSLYSGDAGDDIAPEENCAELYKGAWWHTGCKFANLNGMYHISNPTETKDGIHWEQWKGFFHSLKKTEMKIRMT